MFSSGILRNYELFLIHHLSRYSMTVFKKCPYYTIHGLNEFELIDLIMYEYLFSCFLWFILQT